jgi:hypothetical protein
LHARRLGASMHMAAGGSALQTSVLKAAITSPERTLPASPCMHGSSPDAFGGHTPSAVGFGGVASKGSSSIEENWTLESTPDALGGDLELGAGLRCGVHNGPLHSDQHGRVTGTTASTPSMTNSLASSVESRDMTR